MGKTWCAENALLLAVVILLVGSLGSREGHARGGKVSELGRYQGYSEAAYDGARRSSEYLTLSNGVRLAYDLILPARKGTPAAGPLPVLFKYTPYLRTFTVFDGGGRNIIADLVGLGLKERAMLRIRYWVSGQGRLMDPLFRTPWLRDMIKHGYAVIVVERPGTGASFGTWDASHEPGGREASEIIDWIASQPWCDGHIGMFGDSLQAMIQMAAAATGNPHLKAIFPASAPMEMYDAVMYPGGVYNKAFGEFFQWSTAFLQSDAITPVDSDRDGAMLAQARRERSRTLPETTRMALEAPFRDSPIRGHRIWLENSALYPFIDRINRWGIPVCMTNGWYDLFTRDMFFWYANLTVPKRLIVRPVDHSEVEKDRSDLDYGAEARRWFDRWLKGIDNGIMTEPPIHYRVLGAPQKAAWRTCDAWPPKSTRPVRLHLVGAGKGGAGRGGEGLLSTDPPPAPEAFDSRTVEYTATTGRRSRWSSVNWPHNYPDMHANDGKALAYTTPPLGNDVEVTGHPVARLWLATEAPDLDVFVYLEQVDGGGRSVYITEGVLRASHRNLSRAPFDNLGLPFHAHLEGDLEPIPSHKPVELTIALLPTSWRFPKGSRMRIAVAFSDADNFETPRMDPPPVVRLLGDRNHPSSVEIPVSPIP
jgi:putative CocE/NonD family hydrolase